MRVVAHRHGHPGLQSVRKQERRVAHAIIVIARERVDARRRVPQHGTPSLADEFHAGPQAKPTVEGQIQRGEDDATAPFGQALDGRLDIPCTGHVIAPQPYFHTEPLPTVCHCNPYTS